MAAAKKALEGPALPEAALQVWLWFVELNSARGGAYGPNPIGFADIGAWAQLTGRHPSAQQIDWLRMVDRIWMDKPKPEAADDSGD